MPMVNAEEQRRLREYKAPTCGYRRGEDGEIEKEIFDGVLPGGWFDTPAHVDGVPDEGPAPARGPETVVESETAEEQPETPTAPEGASVALAAPYAQYGFAELRKSYKKRTGKGAKIGTSTADLIRMHGELDAA